MNKWKRAAGVVLAMVMVIACMLPVRMNVLGAETPIPKVQLAVGVGQETPAYQAGETRDLSIKITNQGSEEAGNVRITPVVKNAQNWPFEIQNMNYELDLGSIPAGESIDAVWEDLKARDDVESKSYKLTFQITYDQGENQIEVKKNIFAKMTAKPEENSGEDPGDDPGKDPGSTDDPSANEDPNGTDDPLQGGDLSLGGGEVYNTEPVSSGGGSTEPATVPRVIVTGFRTEPGDVNAGSNFRLVAQVKNTSSRTAVSNMLFDFQAPSSGTEAAAEAPAFLPSSGSSTIYVDSIPAGATRDIAIDLNARADLVQKPYSITMSAKYEDSDAVQYESSSSLAIPVKQPARFEFSDIEVAPDTVAVGDEANITCSLYNTGRVKLYNVKVSFQGDGIEGSDIFVGNVDSGATGTIDGILSAVSEMDGSQPCKMIVTYEDESGNPSTTEKEFPLMITPAQIQSDMIPTSMGEIEQESSKMPLVIGVIAVIVVIVLIVVVVKLRKKKKAALEEEDLVNEVDRFTEDE